MQRRPVVVSFSGIDGAGKSTQIQALCQILSAKEGRWKLYRFWDDVVAFAALREKCSLGLFRGDRGIGSPERPIERRDKNVASWPVLLLRLFLYTADALCLRAMLKESIEGTDFVIFDRYIYDEWANLPLRYWAIRFYIRAVTNLVPPADVAILLDADPFLANQRKPEYPLEFVQRNREAYLSLAPLASMTVIPPSSVSEATDSIVKAITALLHEKAPSSVPRIHLEAPDASGTQVDQSPFFSTTSSH